METIFAVTGFVTVAAITPGPNNFIVMGAAARGGLRAAAPPVAGVILGSLVLLTLAWAGAGLVFEAEPRLRTALMLAGCLYLIWLGVNLILRTSAGGNETSSTKAPSLPITAPGLAAFQLLNPKSWVMVLTATAAISSDLGGVTSLAMLAAIFTAVTAVCLVLWALAGAAIAGLIRAPAVKRTFDRAMGGLLIVSAFLLLV